MSHFSVLVISEEKPTQEVLETILQPWHEYECTGIKDQYVTWQDKTTEVTELWNTETKEKYKNAEGQLFSSHDAIFYTDPTAEEEKKIGPFGGSGFGGGISYSSRDWGDGKGYRAKVQREPDPALYTKVQIPISELFPSLQAYAEEYHGYDIENGQIGRWTNENSKWDWWMIGGRYSGKLIPKKNAEADKGLRSWTNQSEEITGFDICRKGDLDLVAMKEMKRQETQSYVSEVFEKIKANIPEFNIKEMERALAIRKAIHAEYDALPEENRPPYREWYEARNDQDTQFLTQVDKSSWGFSDIELGNNPDIQSYIKNTPALSTWAIVKDGKWYEKGEMGWWGMSSGDKDDWSEQVEKLLQEIPDNAWIAVIDCHI